jgi:hypothetical protein
MPNCIGGVFEALFFLLAPATGRHRARQAPPPPLPPDTPTMPLPLVRRALRGEDIRLVRPYILDHEQRQRGRKQQLIPATHRFAAEPNWIHGAEVIGA